MAPSKDKNGMGMNPAIEVKIDAKTTSNADESDKPAENGEVVNAESIKANLNAALAILNKYGIQAPSGAAGLAMENVNGMTTRDLQGIVDRLAGAERAAGGAVVQRESANLLESLVSPFKQLSRPRGRDDDGIV